MQKEDGSVLDMRVHMTFFQWNRDRDLSFYPINPNPPKSEHLTQQDDDDDDEEDDDDEDEEGGDEGAKRAPHAGRPKAKGKAEVAHP